jgi:hypothetical protein
VKSFQLQPLQIGRVGIYSQNSSNLEESTFEISTFEREISTFDREGEPSFYSSLFPLPTLPFFQKSNYFQGLHR